MTDLMLEKASEKLKKAGVRMTAQRKVIMKYIYQNHNHPTAEEIFEEICRNHPDFASLSAGTIYNNLKILKKHGLIREIYSHNGIARYDSNVDIHHHLLCMYCGKIIDFYHPISLPIEELHQKNGFKVEDLNIEVRGKCRECEERSVDRQE